MSMPDVRTEATPAEPVDHSRHRLVRVLCEMVRIGIDDFARRLHGCGQHPLTGIARRRHLLRRGD